MIRIDTKRRDCLLLLAFIAVAVPSWAQTPNSEEGSPAADGPPSATQTIVEPSDVYARLMFLQGELDQIRFELGKPKPVAMEEIVSEVEPREVYFQAETLFRKANRLSFEYTREVSEAPPRPGGVLKPADVMLLVEASLVRLTRVKTHLGNTESSVSQPPDRSKSPTDVIRVIMTINRQLNLLLDRPFSPAEVYEQLTLAIGYAARLRAQFPGERIPAEPPFVRGKRPIDVYRKLIDCFAIVHQIAARSTRPMLIRETRGDIDFEVTPSDVYDIATLVVSELAYLWAEIETAAAPRPAFYPGRKLPSHVHQRASLLERQLIELAERVDGDPGWLDRQ